MTLGANVTVDTSAADQDITFDSTIDGTHKLTLNSGTGTAAFGAVGATIDMSSITVTAATINQNSTVKTTGNVLYMGAAFLNGDITTTTGTFIVTGAVTLVANVAADMSAGNQDITFDSTVDGTHKLTLNSGTGRVAFGAVGSEQRSLLTVTAATIDQNSTVKTTGNVFYTGAASLSGDITTTSGTFHVTGAVTLGVDVTVDTSADNQNITFDNTINGGHNLALNAGTGAATVSGIIGGTTALASLTISGTGPVTLTEIGGASAGVIGSTTVSGTVGGITLNGGTYNANAQTYSGAVTLVVYTTVTSNNAEISFDSAIDGAYALSLAAGTGSITLTGAVGAATQLGDLTIVSASNVTAVAITATTLTQSAGTGTSTFNGAINTSAIGGVNLTGSAFAFNATTTTTGGGGFTLVNSGTATFALDADLSVDGAFSQSGSGSVSTAANITTKGGTISFAAPIALTGTITMMSIGGDQTYTGAITGVEALTLNACTGGSITVGNVGTVGTPLTSFTTYTDSLIKGTVYATTTSYNSCATVTLCGTYTEGVNFNGDFIVNGNATLTCDVFIYAGTYNITFTGDVDSGVDTESPYSLDTNSTAATVFGGSVGGGTALASLTTGSDGTLDIGSVTTVGAQRYGNKTATLRGTYTTTDSDFTVEGAVTLSGDTTVTAGTGAVTFSDTVDGAHNLTVHGETAALGAVGATIALSSLTVTAATIDQSSTVKTIGNVLYTGAASLNGDITTTSGTFHVTGAVTLGAPVKIDTSAADQDITFDSTIDGSQNLKLNAGTGRTTVSGIIGGTTALASLTISGTWGSVDSNRNRWSFCRSNRSTTVSGTVGGITLNGVHIMLMYKRTQVQ